MKFVLLTALVIAAVPAAVMAMPKVGDGVGVTPDEATVALGEMGCKVDSFDTEDGMIEAKCIEEGTDKLWEIYIDPKTGLITDMKSED